MIVAAQVFANGARLSRDSTITALFRRRQVAAPSSFLPGFNPFLQCILLFLESEIVKTITCVRSGPCAPQLVHAFIPSCRAS